MRNKNFLIILLNCIAILLAIILQEKTKLDPFSEGGFITYLSAAQLLFIAWLSYTIFKTLHNGKFTLSALKESYGIWFIIAFGFLFLSADELFRIHENIDWTIHSLFRIQESGISDRLDDLIIGIYGIIGIIALYYYRKEIIKYTVSYAYFITGFILMFCMVVSDTITNRNDILPYFFEKQFSYTVQHWLSTAEDSFKLLAVAFFVLAFCSISEKVKQKLNSQ